LQVEKRNIGRTVELDDGGFRKALLQADVKLRPYARGEKKGCILLAIIACA
jgi:hypothetical protein